MKSRDDTIYKLAVFEEGTGQSVILLHGMISTHRYWRSVIQNLEESNLHIVAPDLLGHGDSPKPKNAKYDLKQHVECAVRAVTEVADPPYVLVGHSMGAIIALYWAASKPELFSQLVLTGLPYLVDHKQKYGQLVTAGGEQRLLKRRPFAQATIKGVSYAGVLPKKLVRLQKTWPEHIAEDWTMHGQRAYKRTIQNAVLGEAIVNELENLTVPTRLIVGTQDGIVGTEGITQFKRIAAKNKNLTLQVLEAGHNIPLIHPEIVAKAILQV